MTLGGRRGYSEQDVLEEVIYYHAMIEMAWIRDHDGGTQRIADGDGPLGREVRNRTPNWAMPRFSRRVHLPRRCVEETLEAWTVLRGILATQEVHPMSTNYCSLGQYSLGYQRHGVKLLRAPSRLVPIFGMIIALWICYWPTLVVFWLTRG